MKYGYLFYRKPIPELRKERPINLGDPIQSIAVINLYREMGISDEDIIPIEKYDAAYYDGEEAIVIMNGAEHYEHYAYHTAFLPPSKQLTPVYFSLYLDRELNEDVMNNFRQYGPIGCRDMDTLRRLNEKGCGTYLSGCVTMTFPKREKTDKQKSIFLIDCPASLDKFLPEDIRQNGIKLSATQRIRSLSMSNRITIEETECFHKAAQERLDLLRDQAKLVITGRYHAAVPAMAMGIPVILVRTSFDPRFEILEQYLPLYTPDNFDKIDWNPLPVDIEKEKKLIKQAFFSAVRFATARKDIHQLEPKIVKNEYEWAVNKAISTIPFPTTTKFRYVIWGVCLPATQLIVQKIEELYPQGELFATIDTYQTGTYMNRPIISPEEIDFLPEDVIILISAPSVQAIAKEKLQDTNRKFVLFHNIKTQYYHF